MNESANNGFVAGSRVTKAATNPRLEQLNSSSGKIRPGSLVGIATDYSLDGLGSNPGGDEIFCTCLDWPWGPPSPLYNGYRVFPGDKVWLGRAADLSPPSSSAVMEE